MRSVALVLQTTLGVMALSQPAFAGTPSYLTFDIQPGTTAVGSAIAPAVTVLVRDAQGKVVTDATTEVSVRSSQSGQYPFLGLSGTLTVRAVNGVATFNDLVPQMPGKGYHLEANAFGSFINSDVSGAFEATSNAAVELVFTALPPRRVAAGQRLGTVSVEARDWQHRVALAFTDPVVMNVTSFGDPTVAFTGTATVNAIAGVAQFGDLVVTQAGSPFGLSAKSGALFASSTSLEVMAAHATHFVVTLPPEADSPASVKCTVFAHDDFGNIDRSYDGFSVKVTSSDPSIELPPHPLVAMSGAVDPFEVTFHTRGVQTLTITDATNAALKGEASTSVQAFAAPVITIVSPKEGQIVSGPVEVKVIATPAEGTSLSRIRARAGSHIASGAFEASSLTITWDTTSETPGLQTIIAAASDASGNESVASITVEVKRGCGCESTAGSFAAVWLTIGLFVAARRRPPKRPAHLSRAR